MTQLCSIVIIIQGRLQDQYLEDVFYVKLDLMEANKKKVPKSGTVEKLCQGQVRLKLNSDFVWSRFVHNH